MEKKGIAISLEVITGEKKNAEIRSTGKLLTDLVLGYGSSDIYDA